MEKVRRESNSHQVQSIWMVYMSSAKDWSQVTIEDADWDRLITKGRKPFGLFIVSPDPTEDTQAWLGFAEYCVSREIRLMAAWGENSSLLDDIFDEAALTARLTGHPGAEPSTWWHDDESLSDALQTFIDSTAIDLRNGTAELSWIRVVMIVGDRQWQTRLGSLLA